MTHNPILSIKTILQEVVSRLDIRTEFIEEFRGNMQKHIGLDRKIFSVKDLEAFINDSTHMKTLYGADADVITTEIQTILERSKNAESIGKSVGQEDISMLERCIVDNRVPMVGREKHFRKALKAMKNNIEYYTGEG